MYNLTLSAFDVANAWGLYIPYLLILAVLVFVVGFTVVTLFTHRIKKKQADNHDPEKPEQAAQSLNDDTK